MSKWNCVIPPKPVALFGHRADTLSTDKKKLELRAEPLFSPYPIIEKTEEFWKGKNSYKILQDQFYEYVSKAGFDLERGETEKNEHIPIEKLKVMTNYEMQELEKQSIKQEQEKEISDVKELKEDYRRVIRKFNTLAKQYTKVKVIHENNLDKIEQLEKDYKSLEDEFYKVEKNNRWLKHYINKTFECVSILFDFPIERLKSIVNNFVRGIKEDGRKDS